MDEDRRLASDKTHIKLGYDVVDLPDLCSENDEICGSATRPVQAVNQT
jgi:hypothetical protein